MSALVRPQRSPLPLDEIRDQVLAFFMCRVYKQWTCREPGRLQAALTFTVTAC
jgi:hypothetical protein